MCEKLEARAHVGLHKRWTAKVEKDNEADFPLVSIVVLNWNGMKYLEECLDIFGQLKELPNIAACFWWIGTIYGRLNDTSKALKNLKSALEIYEQLGLKNRIQQVREAISKLKSN